MNKMNRKLEYALMSLKFMVSKRPGELTTAKEIVSQTGCPFDATARVLQKMANVGLLSSEQGARGGYQIVKDLKKVSLHELIETILGPLGIAKCLHKGQFCELSQACNIFSPISDLNQKLKDFYRSLNLFDLLKNEKFKE